MAAGCPEYMFPGQASLQLVLVILAVLCIPIMLFGRPVYFLLSRKRKKMGKSWVSKYNFIQPPSEKKI